MNMETDELVKKVSGMTLSDIDSDPEEIVKVEKTAATMTDEEIKAKL